MTDSTRHLIRLSAGAFFTFAVVGLPLPVLPLYLHNVLGFSNAMVGLAVGTHFLATVLVRGLAGKIADSFGGKRASMLGMAACAFSGLPYLLVAIPGLSPAEQFGVILCGRVCLGTGHSLLGTGTLAWGFGLLGPQHAGRVISWSGIANYGSLALGAPVGLALWNLWGIAALGAASCLLPALALCIAAGTAAADLARGKRASASGILGRVWRPGLCLALYGVGYASISAFISLYFDARGWNQAGLALSCFGLGFVLARVLFGTLPDRMDGGRLARICLAGEAAGLALIGLAPSMGVALAGVSITGFSCSLVYPAIGVQVVRSVPAHIRGAATAVFTMFQDISYGLSGPLAGFLVPCLGYGAVFCVAAACAVLGLILSALFSARTRGAGQQ